jgi:hypothetical protein
MISKIRVIHRDLPWGRRGVSYVSQLRNSLLYGDLLLVLLHHLLVLLLPGGHKL